MAHRGYTEQADEPIQIITNRGIIGRLFILFAGKSSSSCSSVGLSVSSISPPDSFVISSGSCIGKVSPPVGGTFPHSQQAIVTQTSTLYQQDQVSLRKANASPSSRDTHRARSKSNTSEGPLHCAAGRQEPLQRCRISTFREIQSTTTLLPGKIAQGK